MINAQQQEKPDLKTAMRLYVDGFAGKEHQGAGFVFKNPNGTELAYALKYNFHSSNNESEYEVLLAGLRMTLTINVDQLIIHGDS